MYEEQPKAGTEPRLSDQIENIDATLLQRIYQIDNPDIESYTLDLLRDPNEAGKKFGQETVEYTSAVMRAEGVEACEEELADLIYAGLVMALSRKKEIRLSNVMGILVARNQAATINLDSWVAGAKTVSKDKE